MIIYRIENAEGRGPYVNDSDKLTDYNRKLSGLHSNPITHPSTIWDGLLDFHLECVSPRHGFDSMEKLIDWFDLDCIDLLAEHGFMISAYSIHEDYVKSGDSGLQVVFDKEYATFIENLPLNLLLSELFAV